MFLRGVYIPQMRPCTRYRADKKAKCPCSLRSLRVRTSDMVKILYLERSTRHNPGMPFVCFLCQRSRAEQIEGRDCQEMLQTKETRKERAREDRSEESCADRKWNLTRDGAHSCLSFRQLGKAQRTLGSTGLDVAGEIRRCKNRQGTLPYRTIPEQ